MASGVGFPLRAMRGGKEVDPSAFSLLEEGGNEDIEGEVNTLLESHTEDSGGPVSDLDRFFTRVYEYYRQKGFLAIVLSRVFNLFTLAFVILFSTFLFCFIDYHVLFATNDLHQALLPIQLSRLHPLLAIFLAVFALFWLLQLLQLFSEIRDKREIKLFYNHTLRISEERLQTMEWAEVVEKLIKVPRLCIVKEDLTSLDVVNRILRKQNYLIALFNLDIVRFGLPIPGLRRMTTLTKTLEWSLYLVLSYSIFGRNEVKPSVLIRENSQKTARSLQWRFRLLGLVSLILSPFVLVFLLAYFFFKYGEELRNRPSFTLASRQWSRLARWKFRCFNELPHALETRLNASHTAANEYVDQFQSNILMICARFVAFVLGAFVAVLIVIAVVDDEILTESQIGGKSLLWYLGISGSVLAVTRALIPREGQVFNPKAKLDEVVCHTYYKPDTWIGEEHMWWVRDELVELYEYKIMAFLRELVSILVAPFILFFTLGSSAVSQDIVNFFQHFTEYVDGVGNMCSCANFETGFAKHGDHNWGSPAALALNKFVKTSQGKMEKSFMDFVTTYPSYRPSEQGADILVKLSKHREAVLRSKAEAHLESSGFIDTNMFASKPGTSNSAGPSSAPWRGTAAVGSSLRFSEPPSLLMQSFHEALMTSGANIFDGLGDREASDKSDDELSAGPSSSPIGL